MKNHLGASALAAFLAVGCQPFGSPSADATDREALADLSLCAGPEGVEDCAPGAFERTFADRLPAMRAHRAELVSIWRERVERGDHAAAYGLAWADAREAVPTLRRALLAERTFYGWESSDALGLEARMRDDNYPRHLARIGAIERLSGVELTEAVVLSPEEREALVRDAFAEAEPGQGADVARWLLTKLAPDALASRPITAPPEPRGIDVSGPDGHVVVSHDSLGHHDVFPIARLRSGRLERVDGSEGCRVLPGATVRLGLPARSVTLPRSLFSNEANRCLAEPGGLEAGSSLGVLGPSEGRGRPIELDPALARSAEARALEALARIGADPADFVGRTETLAFTDDARTRVVVVARATRRPRSIGDSVVPCATPLCEVEQHDGPRASVVVGFALAADGALVEELLVPSRPGGCGEREHDDVSFVGTLLLDGAPPLYAVERLFCDAWEVELYAPVEGRARLVAVRGGSAI